MERWFVGCPNIVENICIVGMTWTGTINESLKQNENKIID